MMRIRQTFLRQTEHQMNKLINIHKNISASQNHILQIQINTLVHAHTHTPPHTPHTHSHTYIHKQHCVHNYSNDIQNTHYQIQSIHYPIDSIAFHNSIFAGRLEAKHCLVLCFLLHVLLFNQKSCSPKNLFEGTVSKQRWQGTCVRAHTHTHTHLPEAAFNQAEQYGQLSPCKLIRRDHSLTNGATTEG